MENKINNFIIGNEEELSLPIEPINKISDILKKLGYQYSNQDTNGWQVDFDIYFENQLGKTLMLRGSMWYGNYYLIKM